MDNEQGAEVVTPALVYGDAKPTTIREYRLGLYIYKALSVLHCDIVDAKGKVLVSRPGEALCSKRSPGGPGTEPATPVELSIAASRLPVGALTVRLSGRYKHDDSSDRFENDIYFYNQPYPLR